MPLQRIARTSSFLASMLLVFTIGTADTAIGALTVDFDFRDQGPVFDGNIAVDFANTGGTAGAGFVLGSFEALVGTLNADTDSLGINGITGDPDFNTLRSGESIEVTFDHDLTFTSIQLTDFDGFERAEITIGSNATTSFLANDGSFLTFTSDNELLAGEILRFDGVSGGGDFGIQGFSAAVPEPGSGLVCLIGLAAISMRRRRA
ncbi:MAG: PEP-CTERM sorting domain-containing protein [Aureliella sp.]